MKLDWRCVGAAFLVGGIAGASLIPDTVSAATSLPRTVLILDQSDPNAPFGLDLRAGFRAVVNSHPVPTTVYLELADLGRSNTPEYHRFYQNYLREKYQDRSIGVLVAHGTAMLEIVLRLRQQLWPSVPVVFASVDQVNAARLNIPSDVTGAFVRFDLRDALSVAKMLAPNLKRVVHVGGPFEQQPFFSHIGQQFQEAETDLEIIHLGGLPMTEIRNRVSRLPDDAVIIYTSMYADTAGSTYSAIQALTTVAEVANRPIVSFSENHIGAGATGGYVTGPGPIGADAARRVLRILDGEAPSSIPVAVGEFMKPMFDWRKLQHFGIDPKVLPPNSEVRFRTPTMWEQYRWQLTAIFAVVFAQTAMIGALLFEHHRRRVAEVLSRRRLLEVMHLNRIATAGAMSASIGHELNQPLGAIVSNAEAAKNLLARNPPDISQLNEIMDDILRDDQRAANIIRHLRGLLKRQEAELQIFDLKEVVADALLILEPEATKRDISISAVHSAGPLPVRADQVHLQQLLLNLAINGMDAIQDAASKDRRLRFETATNDEAEVEVSVLDTGAGIPDGKLESIFETFYTTKSQGTGLGLSIARTIIETYGGRIWAERGRLGGATLRFTLPLVRADSR